MTNTPDRGSSNPCENCKIPKNQHSLSQSGRCDAARKGKLEDWKIKVGKRI